MKGLLVGALIAVAGLSACSSNADPTTTGAAASSSAAGSSAAASSAAATSSAATSSDPTCVDDAYCVTLGDGWVSASNATASSSSISTMTWNYELSSNAGAMVTVMSMPTTGADLAKSYEAQVDQYDNVKSETVKVAGAKKATKVTYSTKLGTVTGYYTAIVAQNDKFDVIYTTAYVGEDYKAVSDAATKTFTMKVKN